MNENIYLEIGKILCKIQHWENEFKLLTQKYNIEKSDDKRSLSNMNSFLLRNNIINEKEYNCIKKVIEYRNFIIHKFFLENDNNKIDEINLEIDKSLNIFNQK